MAHEFESGFVLRTPAWHGLSKVLTDSPRTVEEALKQAGLDWSVNREPVYLGDGTLVEGSWANVRDKDRSILGLVGDRYTVLQNTEALDFMDSLIGGQVEYESAGSLRGGQLVWVQVRLGESVRILDDVVEPFAFIQNSHNGRHGLRAALTPQRIVCMNTLTMAIRGAQTSVNLKHTKNIGRKMEEAAKVLGLSQNYLAKLDQRAQELAQIKVSPAQFEGFLDVVFPMEADTAKRTLTNMEVQRAALTAAWQADDLGNFRGTAWGVFQALTDFHDHAPALRQTETYQESKFLQVLDGSPFVSESLDKLLALVA